ncbi:hypothetical protein AN641_00515 [Candidatus Epulonipiscioides gigas]|nr:hypothetical protein AN641_00515 [Epulopiscium sp. SCG-C07WGA-EpuloA2]
MKIVFASDSFKGSLNSTEICDIGQKIANEIFDGCEVIKIPMADGGEGTVDCLIEAMNGEKVECVVKNPLHKNIIAQYGKFKDSAIMEMSAASGITLVDDTERDILKQSTFGTGQMMLHALENGITNIYIGIGGSATNDGGMGFANAIGVRFLDENNNELDPIPSNFEKIKTLDVNNINPLILNANIVVMCDVTNPLLGECGATNIFGKQKGATPQQLEMLERGMTHYIKISENYMNKLVKHEPGAGAAGGLGAALKLFANAKMCSGVDTILEILDFKNKINGVDLVITGEGQMDYQSAYGKVPSGVGKICKEKDIPCIAIVGAMGERAEEMLNFGINAIVPTVNAIISLQTAIDNATVLYESALRRALSLLKIGKFI